MRSDIRRTSTGDAAFSDTTPRGIATGEGPRYRADRRTILIRHHALQSCTMSISFQKMSGAGNTFIVVDGRDLGSVPDMSSLAQSICRDDREHGGADGFIAVRESGDADFEMLYYNRDGSTGMMCGNGGRCAVRFAADHGYLATPSRIRFINAGVEYDASITESGIRVGFPDPTTIRPDLRLVVDGTERRVHFADVGTPHVIAFVDEFDLGAHSLTDVDVPYWGPLLRNHEAFAPDGANANFVELRGDRSGINLRTFERGVEGETGACGTGAVASGIIAAITRDIPPPVLVIPTSGSPLRVDFSRDADGRVTNVSLEGGAEVVMEGRFEL